MEIAIYQVCRERDSKGVMFNQYSWLKDVFHQQGVDASVYDCVFDGTVKPDEESLEAVFEIFNIAHPEGYRGRSLSVSDIVEVRGGNAVSPGFYYCDRIGWQKISFSKEEAGIAC